MPRENKKRGRREEKKRKHEVGHQESSLKRNKVDEDDRMDEPIDIVVDGDFGHDFISFSAQPTNNEVPFYGLLTPEEQDYYSSVNSKLELSDFESDEDQANFIGAVYRESSGKELKLASSQSCSRYLEKLIRLSSAEQLRALFAKFLGNFTHLVQHRFASHCCEALLRKAALTVTSDHGASTDECNGEPTVEELFLKLVEEIQPHLGYLLTERFASHVIRVLLLVLAGERIDSPSFNTVLASRKKERLEVTAARNQASSAERRTVPNSFRSALVAMTRGATDSLNTTYVRALATHPTGNPVLQLLVRLELTQSDKSTRKLSQSILSRLLPDESLEDGTESAKFLQALLYDPTGSRLIETIIQCAPGKIFKKIYKNLLRDRIGTLAKNDIASYVVSRILERLGKDDLAAACDVILPEIPALVGRFRVGVIRVLIERCNVREVDMQPLATALESAYGQDRTARLPKMLKLDTALDRTTDLKIEKNGKTIRETPAMAVDLHGSLLAQAMLQAPKVCDLVFEGLLAIPAELLLLLSKDSTASRIIQGSLTSPMSTKQFRRKLIPAFYGHMAELAVDPAGSHVADALWNATKGAHFMKESFAGEMENSGMTLRDSRYGRSVWKKWSMDLYLRRRQDWQAQAKSIDMPDAGGSVQKSAIDAARERHTQTGKGFRAGRPSVLFAHV